ncbi:hypothetical protein ACGF0D_43535 [Kitasatospora sp. NPDC048298]|uniref:hypothetical protein n=1 Tax=Kitasatospora sp. NPDC048298 TaxID=3364049 RepID=UPI00371693DD
MTSREADPEETEAGMISRWFSEDEVWRLIEGGELRDAPSVAALGLFQRRRGELDVRPVGAGPWQSGP